MCCGKTIFKNNQEVTIFWYSFYFIVYPNRLSFQFNFYKKLSPATNTITTQLVFVHEEVYFVEPFSN